MTLYLLGGAALVCAAVIGISAVKVSNAERDAADARAELSSVKAAIATERAAFVQAAREKEAKQEAELAAQAAKYFNERMKREAQHMADVARVRDGFRLRDPGARPQPAACTGTGTATAPGSDAATTGDLSESASNFLYSLANEADAVVDQLGACQRYATSVYQQGATQ